MFMLVRVPFGSGQQAAFRFVKIGNKQQLPAGRKQENCGGGTTISVSLPV